MSTVLVRKITSAFSSSSSTISIYSQSSSLSQLSLSSLLSRSFLYKNSLRVSLDRLRSLQQSTLLKTSASTHCMLIQHWPWLICQMPLAVKKTGCSVSRGGGCHGAEQPIVSDFFDWFFTILLLKVVRNFFLCLCHTVNTFTKQSWVNNRLIVTIPSCP
jgi:hypothetical protein